MLKPGNIERGVIGVMAFLMIASGVGALVSFGLREAARAGYRDFPYGYVFGIHSFAIVIPGFVGLFVVLGCGCCNKRPAYVTSLVFDILGLLFYIGLIIFFSILYESSPYSAVAPLDCSYIQGQCQCAERRDGNPFYNIRSDFSSGCDRNNMFYACRAAVFCMWAFGLLFSLVHLVLVCRLSCKLRSGTPGQVLNAPGQNVIPMQAQAPQSSAPVGAPWTGACTGQPPPYSLQAPAQVGDAQASPLTKQPQPSSKSAAPPV